MILTMSGQKTKCQNIPCDKTPEIYTTFYHNIETTRTMIWTNI